MPVVKGPLRKIAKKKAKRKVAKRKVAKRKNPTRKLSAMHDILGALMTRELTPEDVTTAGREYIKKLVKKKTVIQKKSKAAGIRWRMSEPMKRMIRQHVRSNPSRGYKVGDRVIVASEDGGWKATVVEDRASNMAFVKVRADSTGRTEHVPTPWTRVVEPAPAAKKKPAKRKVAKRKTAKRKTAKKKVAKRRNPATKTWRPKRATAAQTRKMRGAKRGTARTNPTLAILNPDIPKALYNQMRKAGLSDQEIHEAVEQYQMFHGVPPSKLTKVGSVEGAKNRVVVGMGETVDVTYHAKGQGFSKSNKRGLPWRHEFPSRPIMAKDPKTDTIILLNGSNKGKKYRVTDFIRG